jgi:hypothetical protein
LRLQECDFKVVYKPGSSNLADSLSWLPRKSTIDTRSNMEACADRYVHYLTQQLVPKGRGNTARINERWRIYPGSWLHAK